MGTGQVDWSLVVLLASFPRSGNTLFRQVLEECYGIPTYTVYGNDSVATWSGRHWPHDIVSGQPVYVVKTHHFLRAPQPIIYIVRDGRDVAVSYRHYMQSQESAKITIGHHEWGKTGAMPLAAYAVDGTWSAHVQWFLNQSPVVVKFENLILDPVAVVADALAQVGFPLGDQASGQLTPFGVLHEQNPSMWREGTTGQWREEFTQHDQDAFWHVNGLAMGHLGYERD